jgi:hypothetical protein
MPDQPDRLLCLIDAEIAARLSGTEGLRTLSDRELIAQLANQAKELGIEIDLSYRLGESPEAGRGGARGLCEGPEIRATVSTDTPVSVPRMRG